MHMCVHEHLHICEYNGCRSKRGHKILQSWNCRGCELPSVSSETGTLVLCKNT